MARTLTFVQTLPASPESVYPYLLNPVLLRVWLADQVQANANVGGTYQAMWNNGYYASGIYTVLDTNKRIAMTWQARNLPTETHVEIELIPEKDSTVIEVRHGGIGGDWTEQEKEIKEGWEVALENLKYTLETGLDKRFMDRPMFGLFPGAVTQKHVTELNLPVNEGVHLSSVVDGMGAAAAGLRANDVLVNINGNEVKDYPTMVASIRGRKGGDVVPVEFYRDGEKHRVDMKLTRRPLPQGPMNVQEQIDYLEKHHADVDRELDELVATTSNDDMRQRPRADEWSGNENLAHLIWTERSLHFLLWGFNSDADFMQWVSNDPIQIAGIVASYPTTEALVEELKRAEATTRAMLAQLPLSLPKVFVARLAQELPGQIDHTRGHFKQIREALECVREANGVSS